MAIRVDADDITRMTDALFLDRHWRSASASRFWVLLVLASVIATAGIIADSTATVIGAMIVAPLMTPILGIALAIVLGDRTHLLRSVGYVLGGVVVVIAVAYLISLIGVRVDDYATNTQVAGRISPRLIDLLGALATGTVGAFALVRRDISDALPGVAIAISLVPPLAVVGVLLQVHRYADASQAMLLFGTNVAAIILTGTLVLRLYKVRDIARRAGAVHGDIGRRTMAVIVGLVVLVAVPLSVGTYRVAYDQVVARQATPIAREWAAAAGWQVTTVSVVNRAIIVTALGPPPDIPVDGLRAQLNAAGYEGNDLVVRLVVGGTRLCPAGGTTCETPPLPDGAVT
ncbi:MAG: DUF389 domain-containing protein [Frankiales bacterium]|nr:DUF389 domain-containing protein [Frankiales bacterium]